MATTLSEGNVGHETALSTDLETDPKIARLLLARVFALLMQFMSFHIFSAFVCTVCAIVFC